MRYSFPSTPAQQKVRVSRATNAQNGLLQNLGTKLRSGLSLINGSGPRRYCTIRRRSSFLLLSSKMSSFNVLVRGDEQVGKTAFVRRHMEGEFESQYLAFQTSVWRHHFQSHFEGAQGAQREVCRSGTSVRKLCHSFAERRVTEPCHVVVVCC